MHTCEDFSRSINWDLLKWWWWWWLVLYSAILCSQADSLHSHVILHEWLAFYKFEFYSMFFEYPPKWLFTEVNWKSNLWLVGFRQICLSLNCGTPVYDGDIATLSGYVTSWKETVRWAQQQVQAWGTSFFLVWLSSPTVSVCVSWCSDLSVCVCSDYCALYISVCL